MAGETAGYSWEALRGEGEEGRRGVSWQYSLLVKGLILHIQSYNHSCQVSSFYTFYYITINVKLVNFTHEIASIFNM